jgi:high-affinity Fe2+/Pb2+ permease
MKPQKQVAALALLSSTALFPIIILSPFTGNIIPLLGNFAVFYAFFGTGVLILLAMAYEGRSVRIARPKNSRIRK